VRQLVRCLLLGTLVASLAACSGSTGLGRVDSDALPDTAGITRSPHGATGSKMPEHIVVIVQENRSVDNLFNGLPGADTQKFGLTQDNRTVQLAPLPLGANYDPSHTHDAFVTEFNNGEMNGFGSEPCGCPPNIAYSYVPQSDVEPYFQLAEQYAFADHVRQSNEGPSFPAHLYLIAGQSGTPGSNWYIADNPENRPGKREENCLELGNQLVPQIDMTTPYPGVEGNPTFRCVNPPTLLDELNAAGISWKYYTPNLGSIWTAPYAVWHLANSPADRARVIVPETTVLSDIADHTLAQVSYVIPRDVNSDHPGTDWTGGPAWVSSIVNAIAADPYYWPNTAIVVVWDDWGGWYDHYLFGNGHPASNHQDPYEYGFRVPLLAIGPYVKNGYISHKTRDFTAILHFIEDVYGLPSLGKLDAQTDDLFDMFDFGKTPHKHRPIPTGKVTIQSLRMLPPSNGPIDSD
jgi:phospholipase C